MMMGSRTTTTMTSARTRSSAALNNPMMRRKEVEEREKEVGEWEVRPGGMLVQRRSPDSESAVAAAAAAAVPTIRVKVKYQSVYYEIYLSSQSTFGELKKLLGERTGVHPLDQKIMYKERERESGAFLDICGVKDKSKLTMEVDPTAHAKRLLEAHRAAKLNRAATAIKDITSHVDQLSLQVTDVDASVSKGKKVADKDILNLIEQLMAQLIKLDGIVVDGDIKQQRGIQVRRVQKYVETLDMLKVKNSKIASVPLPSQHHHHQQQQPHKKQQPPPLVVTTTNEWEMFDSLFMPSTSASTTTSSNSTAPSIIAPRSDWELF